MTKSICGKQQGVSLIADKTSPLRRLIQILFTRRRRRARFDIRDLPPELLNDIGVEVAPRHAGSLEETWRRELDHQRK